MKHATLLRNKEKWIKREEKKNEVKRREMKGNEGKRREMEGNERKYKSIYIENQRLK